MPSDVFKRRASFWVDSALGITWLIFGLWLIKTHDLISGIIVVVSAVLLLALAYRRRKTLQVFDPRAPIWPNFAAGIMLMIVGMSEISGGHRTGNQGKGWIFGSATMVAGVILFAIGYRRTRTPEHH